MGAEPERDVDVADPGLDDLRRAGIRDGIARRIRTACGHFSDEEFSRLVEEMTDRQLIGERRINRAFWVE